MEHNGRAVLRPLNSRSEKPWEEERSRAEVERIIARYQKLVCITARRYFPGLSQDQDLLQCGLIGLWEAIKTWHGEGRFSTYASRSIRNNMKDYLRMEHKASPPAGRRGGEPTGGYEDEVIDRLDMLARIEEAWPENSRERYVLIALSRGVSWHSLAAALGIQLHTARRIAMKAMEGLK